MPLFYFEDVLLGDTETVGEHVVTREEIVEFARKYDPQPIHLDEEAAKQSTHGGLIASACQTMAISALLLNRRETKIAMIAGGGWDDVRFPTPVRPGDRLTVTAECIERRESKSKPDRGVARYKIVMSNDKGDPVLTYKTVLIVHRRS